MASAEVFLRCGNCNAPLSERDLRRVRFGVVDCPYCGVAVSVPRREQPSEVLTELIMAQHELEHGHFNDAWISYDKARARAEENGSPEPEAYFGMALAECQIRYLYDAENKRNQPICYRVMEESFFENESYQLAVRYATEKQREIYRERAEEIDRIRKRFIELEKSGVDYDVFICVKVSENKRPDEANRKYTQDYIKADKIYDILTQQGCRPFFSEKSIKKSAGETGGYYEAHILYALCRAKVMLVVCGNKKYLRTPYVQNEYMRYHDLMDCGFKNDRSLAIVWSGKTIEVLPGVKGGKLQGISYDDFEASERIRDYVALHVSKKAYEPKPTATKTEKKPTATKPATNPKPAPTVTSTPTPAPNPTPAPAPAAKTTPAPAAKTTSTPASKPAVSKSADFEITEEGVLKKYRGKDQHVVIPNSVTSIGGRAFYDCSNLIFITIPDSVTSIGEDAFYRCDNLTSITIPNSVTSIGESAFEFCENLEKIEVDPGNKIYHSVQNCLIETQSKTLIAGCKNSVIPNSVTRIGEYAFCLCLKLTSITIPNSVTSIGDLAFCKCLNLTSITIPNSVTSIGVGAFGGCENLEKIKLDPRNKIYHSVQNCLIETQSKTLIAGCKNSVIPSSVTSIGKCAFWGCENLTSITIPNSVTSIGAYAFQYSRNLKTIRYIGTKAQWQKVSKEDKWKDDVPATVVHCTDGDVSL